MPKKSSGKSVKKTKPKGLALIAPVYEYDWIELSASVPKNEFIAEMNRMGKDAWSFLAVSEHGGMTRVWFTRLK